MENKVDGLINLDEFFIKKENKNQYVDIRLEITNPEKRDEIISKLMECTSKGIDLIDGATVSTLYFSGHDVENSVAELKEKMITDVVRTIQNFEV